METKPYPPSPPSATATEVELPMRWADGSTVRPGQTLAPPSSGFGTSPPTAPRRSNALRGALIGGLGGGTALAVLLLVMRPGANDSSSSSTPTTPAATAKADDATKDAPPKDTPVAVADAPKTPCPTGMALVPGGKFFMGTDADDPVLQTARPAHPAEVAAFCMDLREVSLGDYRQCSTKGECKRAYRESEWPQGSTPEADWKLQMKAHSELCNEAADDRDTHPVNCVDWAQAQKYCEWRGGTLPTEAQWEFAARGSDGRVYSWGDALPSRAHMNGAGPEYVAWRASKGLPSHATLYPEDDGFVGTAPVGSLKDGATQHGLFDMAGNVFEWTADEFTPYPSKDGTPAAAPPAGTKRRVIRGGAFNSFQPQFADPALRFPQAEDAHTHGIGFRCVQAPKPV
jgi:formylglycine-generating enzyme required for sulfatase activity